MIPLADRRGWNAGLAYAAELVREAARTAEAVADSGEATRLVHLAASISRQTVPLDGDGED